MKKIEFFVSDDNLIFEKESDCINHEQKSNKKEKPYIYKFKLDLKNLVEGEYNPNYGDDRKCECGHSYYRHFDSYEEMYACGCKYCGCGEFIEEDLSYKVGEVEKLDDKLISYLEIEERLYERVRERKVELEYNKDLKVSFKDFCEKMDCAGLILNINKSKTIFSDYKKEDWILKYKKDFKDLEDENEKMWLKETIKKIEEGMNVFVYMEVGMNLNYVELTYGLEEEYSAKNKPISY